MTSIQRIPMIVVGLALLLSIGHGIQYLVSEEQTADYFFALSVAFLFLMTILSIDSLQTKTPPTVNPAQKIDLGLILLGISFILSVYFNSQRLIYVFIALMLVVLSVGIGIRGKSHLATLGLMTCVVIFNILLIVNNPIDPIIADMLPLIQAAAQHFLEGSVPYGKNFPDASSFPFAYLPGTWLAYLPLVKLDLDLRILNILIFCGIIIVAEYIQKKTSKTRYNVAWLYAVLASPLVTKLIVHGQIWPYWFLIFISTTLLLFRRHLLGLTVLGLAMGTRLFTVFLAAPLAVFLLRTKGLKKFIFYTATFLGAFSLLFVPFLISSPEFLESTFFARLERGSARAAETLLDEISVSNIITTIEAGYLLSVAQLLVLGLLSLRLWLRPDSLPGTIILLGTAYLWFISLSTQVFRYYYVPGFMIILLGWFFLVGDRSVSIKDDPGND